MKQSYLDGIFGRCPRVSCGEKTLPIGQVDVHGQSSVKVYCPACDDVYHPRSNRYRRIDGSFFGTSFPHLFFLTYPKLRPMKRVINDSNKFVAKVFGFRMLPLEEGEGNNENKEMDKKVETGIPGKSGLLK